jgi:hypothetical protein
MRPDMSSLRMPIAALSAGLDADELEQAPAMTGEPHLALTDTPDGDNT